MEYFKLWIDFNGNGVLTDAGELVHSSNYQWNGTKTVTASFTVPTSVYNGEVYMRFVMQYSGSPVICGTYSYGNTFDFKTRIVGATDPFSYTGYVYNYSNLTTPIRQLGWQTAIAPSVQYQIFEFNYYATNPTTTYTCDIAKLADTNSAWPTIQLFVNNESSISSS